MSTRRRAFVAYTVFRYLLGVSVKELHSEIEINAPVERVWEVLTDFASYPRWNPFIRRGVFHSRDLQGKR